jgi:capsular polysaccharide biosynthesis protein
MRDVGDQGAAATFVSNALRRHLALIIILGLLGSAAGVAAALKSGIRYTATASVLLNPLQGNPFAPDGRGEQLINLETEAELVNTEAVAVLAGKKLRTDMSPDQMRELVSVENPTNTQVLRISFTGHSRDEALDGTQAFADSYLTYRGNRAKSISDARLARIRKQQTETQSKLAERLGPPRLPRGAHQRTRLPARELRDGGQHTRRRRHRSWPGHQPGGAPDRRWRHRRGALRRRGWARRCPGRRADRVDADPLRRPDA